MDKHTYSFAALFFAARNRVMTLAEKHAFMSMPQVDINIAIKSLAEIAGWLTEDKTDSEGKIYTVFCPALPA